MVVIDGPRFSTRAESRDYADRGWTLINMTGAPEAALARELRMCLATIALVTDMDAGAEAAEAVTQQDVFALFAANTERLKTLLTGVLAELPDPDRLHLRHLGRRPRPHLRDPVKVLLTGSAGFIGSAIDRALTARGDEVVRVDLMLPDAHGTAEPPPGTHRLDVRDASAWTDLLAGRGGGVPSGGAGRARRPRGRPALLRLPQRPGHRSAARRHARGRRRAAGAGVVDGGLRRGPLLLPPARTPDARAAVGGRPGRGPVRQHLPGLRR